MVIDEWSKGAARYRSTIQTFQEGQRVPITIEYFQGDGNRGLRLAWRRPSELRAMQASKPKLDLAVDTYLPKGGGWYDFWTGERLEGGRWVRQQVPLNIVPLYVRAGSIVPMGPAVQYATQSPEAPYEVRIYPGADARFTVYEDDNETYDYEKGRYCAYDLVWYDKARRLAVGARHGSFPGCVVKRQLNVVLAGGAGARGGIEPARLTRQVSYSGRAIVVRLDR